ncbi:methionyl-tRNA formyltransferase [Candidatus Pelagibacter sp.]|nr:methionyl-tRNA formyltransferase [Candidatus Pelagibacter sp.]
MPKKIIFMGTPMFAVPILKSLYQNGFPINLVYTQPPQKSHRGQKINKSPVQSIAETLNINFRSTQSLNNNTEEYEFLKKMNADLAIVVAYGQIIPKEFLSLTKKGFINIHASILPKWRGAAPIQRAIMNLDTETGISIMRINEELDCGPISNIYKIKIDQKHNAEEVSEKLSLLAADKILNVINEILDGKSKFVNQDNSKATYAKKITKNEGLIDWKSDALKIIGKINGLYPSPGAFFNFNGQRYKILKAEIGKGTGHNGEVISDNLEIACGGEKSIKVLEIQREGKKIQKIEEFLPGSKIIKGSIISNV